MNHEPWKTWGQLHYLKTLSPTSLSLTDFRSKMIWDSSKKKTGRDHYLLQEVTNKLQKFVPQNLISTLFPNIMHTAPLSYCGRESLQWGSKKQQQNHNYKDIRNSKPLVYGDSRPNLWEDHAPEEGDTQAFQQSAPSSQASFQPYCQATAQPEQLQKKNSDLTHLPSTFQHYLDAQPHKGSFLWSQKTHHEAFIWQRSEDAFEVGWVFVFIFSSYVLNLTV